MKSLKKSSEPQKLPPTAVPELTYKCNHKCFFCSCPWEDDNSYKENELSADQWKDVIDTLLSNGVEKFSLTGGEASTRDDIREIIGYIARMRIPLNIISNGRSIDDDFPDFLAEQKVSICISVPGFDTFEAHTGIDNIGHVLSLFTKTKERGIDATADITVTKKNLGELYENISYPLIYGADYILLNRFLPGGRGLQNTAYLLTIDEVNEMLDIAEEILSKADRCGHVGTEMPLCAIKNPEKYKHIRIGTSCSAAKNFFVVDPSGYIKVCNHSPKRLCRYDEIENLSTDPYWLSFVNRDYLPEMCRSCDKNDICDGGCREAAHVYAGSVNGKDPLFYNG